MRRPVLHNALLLVTAITLGALRAQAQSAPPPVLSQSIPTQTLAVASSAQTVNLSSFITNPTVPGTAVRISVIIGNQSTGNIDVALTDQQTPLTVANFLAYINTGAYANNFFHRSVPKFIIQDGGFYFPNSTTYAAVPIFAPVKNEPGISNVRGTIAMAKLGTDSNSATSQWFINLADNSANLDNQNGGFTVFGNVIGNTMTVADAIAAVPTYNATGLDAAFTDLPLTSPTLSETFFIRTSIAVIPGTTFSASVVNGSLVTATVSGNTLQLTPSAVNRGSTTVTVTASALDGGTLTTSFGVTVSLSSAPTFSLNPFASSVVAGAGTTFSVGAAGVPVPTLQWQSAPAGSGTFTNLANGGSFAGVTTATLSVTNATVAMSGLQFRCVAGNSVATGVTSGPATLTVTPAPASVTLSSLTPTYTGAPLPVTVTTNPVGLAVTVTYSGNTTTAPTNVGSYPVTVVVTDANHTGSISGTLVIAPAPATVTLSSLTPTYTGAPLPVTVTTNPAALAVTVTYSGNTTTAPTNAGSYPVTVVITDANHTGAISGTLVIAPAPATVTLSSLTPTFTGSPLPVAVTTNPAALAVTVTYSGNTTAAPTNAGSYPVTVVITDANHIGTTSGTLVIAQAPATVTLSNLTPTYTGTPLPVTVTTNPSALAVTVTYSGNTTTAPTSAGTYPVSAVVTDANHIGSSLGTLVIAPAPATVTLSNLAQAYTGAPLAVTVNTNPAALAVAVLYNGSSTLPVGVGSYPVAASISDLNHTGTAGGTFSILPDYASFLAQSFSGAQLTNPAVVGPNANPAGDGLPNLLKYAFGLDPTQSDATAGLPVVGSVGGALTLTYIQRTDISDITYVVEVSSDLVTWSSGVTYTQQISSIPIDAQHNQVTVKALPVVGATARFIRLKVTQP